MEKPYAVVYFLEQASYSEIPSNWLLNTEESTGATTCKWLPSIIKNLNFQFKNRLTPCDDWPIYEVKIIRYCEVILKKLSSWHSAEFSKAGTNWFRLGNQRARQQPGQKQKQNEHQKDVDIRQQN